MRSIRLRSDDPLIDEAVQNLSFGFRSAIEELLVTAKSTNVAQQDDVVFDASGDAVHDFLRRKPNRRGSEGGCKENSANENAAHQKVDPKLKKI